MLTHLALYHQGPYPLIMKRTAVIATVVLAGAAALAACAARHVSGRLVAMQDSDHYRDGRFHNLIPGDDVMTRGGMWSTMREFVFDNTQVREPTAPIATVPRTASELGSTPAAGLQVTWLGHSTLLIDIDGARVLTDPVWSERASPVGFAGPKRFHAPPLPLEELPPLDAVLISHDHYDHLDQATIKTLAERVPLFIVPLGVGEYLREWGVSADRIRELDWWQETTVGAVTLACTPARHFSGRGLFNRNTTLWASWALIGPEHRAYFSGDGGYSPSFADIGKRYGPFDITMMETGAYHPRWSDIHNGPEQAVQAHRDLRGQLMLPIHWGTFNLALHTWTAPAERTMTAASAQGVRLVIPRPGETIDSASAPLVRRWWPELPYQTAAQLPVVSPGLLPSGPTVSTVVAR